MKNNYEEALKQKLITTQVVESINLALGRKASGEANPNNDKARLYVESYGPDISIKASYGYYGSSSSYNAYNVYLAEYLVRAINSMMGTIADKAIEIAKRELLEAQRAAARQAQDILDECGKEGGY